MVWVVCAITGGLRGGRGGRRLKSESEERTEVEVRERKGDLKT